MEVKFWNIPSLLFPLYSKYQVIRKITPQELKDKLGAINKFIKTSSGGVKQIVFPFTEKLSVRDLLEDSTSYIQN